MRLKDKLILRKVADQHVIVPVGRRALEVRRAVKISPSAAYLWEFMEKDEFTVDSLTELIMGRFTGVTEEKARADIEKFLEVLKRNNILEPEPGESTASGFLSIKIDEEERKMLEELKKSQQGVNTDNDSAGK
ncbi:MAG: PqqD family protein [Parasporobacterium sp.]|nr:PqqD family protein [Parasporobacterium sp.]